MNLMYMITKYGFDINDEVLNKQLIRLINQMWKLIPMKEHNENWEKQLDSVIIEIAGLNEIFSFKPLFLQLLSKLEGLKVVDINFNIYRQTVFDAINLLQELKNE